MNSKNKPATRADVARKANVSETIVSYVMNNNRSVDKEKKERVLQAAKELNYRPNQIALALSGKSSSHILFMVDSPENERLNKLLSELEKYAYDKGSLVSLCRTRNDMDFIKQIIGRRFDGVIISSTNLSEEYIGQLINAGVPTVLLLTHSYSLNEGVGKIGTGLTSGVQGCIEYLSGLGRKNLLFLDRMTGNGKSGDLTDSRLRGFALGMKKLNQAWENRVLSGYKSEGELGKALSAYIERYPVDGIIARNDRLALLAMNVLQDKGIRIPQDIAMIGFDNSTMCRLIRPSLSSVKFDDAGIAKEAVDMIYRMRKGDTITATVHFPFEIIKRASTEGEAQGGKRDMP